MQIKVLQSSLKTAISQVSRAVATRSTLPVLSNILIQATETGLQLCANNLETGIIVRCGALIEEHGAITIPAKALADLVNDLPNDTIDLKLDSRTNKIKIACRGSSYSFSGIDADEFPIIPTIADEPIIELASSDLITLIESARYAAADEHTNPLLQGVHICIKPYALEVESIDGYRMAVEVKLYKKQIRNSEVDLVIPAKSLEYLKSVFPQDEAIQVFVNDRGVAFVGNNATLYSRIIDGEFPDIDRFIPPFDSDVAKATVKTADMIKAVKRASKVALLGGNVIRLQVEGAKLTLSVAAAEIGEGIEELALENETTPAEVAVNIRYLAELLNHAPDTITLMISRPSTPLYMRYGDDSIHLIMPMRLPETLKTIQYAEDSNDDNNTNG